ncbi:MAG: sulfotransferase [Sandaracinaceae bacterium]
MTLRIIGAGWGRTGTSSLKVALEKLGCGRCYHWAEVKPHEVPVWFDALAGKPVDWAKLLEGWGAAIDWPASHFYREIAEAFPESKVVLTTRDPERWFESATQTIYRFMNRPLEEFGDERPGWTAEESRALIRLSRRIIIEETLGAPFDERPHEDPDLVRRCFEAHTRAVKEAIAPERLLHFEVSEGWEPLCAFLGVAVPDEPFPRKNTRKQFNEHIEGSE